MHSVLQSSALGYSLKYVHQDVTGPSILHQQFTPSSMGAAFKNVFASPGYAGPASLVMPSSDERWFLPLQVVLPAI